MVGIYIIQNLINNKVYIGKSVNIEKRFIRHLSELRHNRHCNPYLQKAFNKYNESNFKLKVLEECSEKELDNKEKYWIKYYKDKKICELYNITDGGTGGKMPQYIIDKARPKISKAAKEGNYVRHIGKANGMYGRHHTEESKKLMSKHSKGQIPWNKGKHWSEEVKEKISKANKGRKHTEEAKQKMKKSHKKVFWNDNKRIWFDGLCVVCRLLNFQGISFYKLGKLLNVNPETVRTSVRNYEKRNGLPTKKYLCLPEVSMDNDEITQKQYNDFITTGTYKEREEY